MSAVVITPTRGIPELADAIKSVATQGDDVQHWVVVDGAGYARPVIDIAMNYQHPNLQR